MKAVLRRRTPLAKLSWGVVVAAVIAAPLAAAQTAAAADSGTTVLSSTFDDGTIAPWTGNGGAKLSVVADPDGTGKSLEATGITAGYMGPAVDLTKLLTPGTAYTVSFEARLADAAQPADSVHFTVDDGNYTWIASPTAITADSWTTITGSYTLAASATKANMYLDSTVASGAAYPNVLIDNVTITGPAGSGGTGGTGSTCTYPTGDTIVSSDFESGDADGWVARADGKGSATVSVTDTLAHGGTHSLEASGRTDQGQGVGHDVTCLLEPGQTYEFSGWVRFAAGAPTDDVWLSLANTAGGSTSYTTLGQFTNVTNTGWAQLDQKFTMPASSDSALLYVETKYYSDGSAGNVSDLYFDDLSISKPSALSIQDITPIKDTLPFPVGAAVSDPQITGAPGQLLVKHFDQVTPENTMKPEAWYNADHSFKTTNADADQLMTFAQQNDLRVYGHNLVWYQQTPDWFFQDDQGNWLTNSDADKAIMRARLDTHIKDVAQYLSKFGAFGSSGNPLVSFDVVNEAVSDNVGDPDDLRQSHWYQILGPEYIEDAFNDANKYFNEDAAHGGFAADGAVHPITLFYNDYNTEQAGKLARVQELVKKLIADGVPIDGIGHQFHVTLSTPLSSLKDAIDGFNGITTASGKPLQQAVTELDVPTGTPVTTANQIDQGYYYQGVFDMLRSEAASGASIFSATVWGLTDGQSWRASSGAPLLFDDDLQAKPAYYGVTDQKLPAKQLSAIVFQQSATDAWDQLPLHPIAQDGSSGFQLRWASDHLTAYVSVTDGTTDAADQAAFAWGDGTQTATVKRDGTVTGTGVTATVTSTSTGWNAVVTLPLSGLTTASTPKFDVTVTNGTHTDDWNTPGTLGSLQLVEPLSFTTIPEASVAPSIDGTKDPVWSEASKVTTSKLISGSADGAKATVSQLWKDDYLYVFAEVTDPTIDTTSGNAYEQDSVEIFTDLGNAKNGSYRADDAQMRISADNAVSFGAGDSEAAQQARLTSATARTATGYVVEARIDLKDTTGVGKFEGVDYEVNDGTAGARTANFGWAEQTGTAYQTTSRWGVAELEGPAQYAPKVSVQPHAASGHPGDTVTFTATADAKPAATVVWQSKAPKASAWTTISGAKATTLSVKVNASLDGTSYRAVFTNSVGSTATDAATLTVVTGKPVK
ncbi:endo-1,4-beta-xylanase [Gryllotalpicola daejeonensis]|uniref:Beta-xylanase n=1 Tax=Gryllotalpicola daejeonensis TaxID=993087 RepID=A0ABP7ZHQ8_9MICO